MINNHVIPVSQLPYLVKISNVTGLRVLQDIIIIVDNGGTRQSIYCNMEGPELCGSKGGWTRLAYLDMSDDTQSCPPGFHLYNETDEVRACGRNGTNPSWYQFSSHLMVSVILRYVVE